LQDYSDEVSNARTPASTTAFLLTSKDMGKKIGELAAGTQLVGFVAAAQWERVREALGELGMLHALNPPSKLVTVSLGGATNVPAQSTIEQTALLASCGRSGALCGQEWRT
jgi:hypothetical protein